MFSWGEKCQRGFGSRSAVNVSDAGVRLLNLGRHVGDLSAGHSVVGFVKTNGDAFIIRTSEDSDGGKQNLVKCKEKIQAVSCGDEAVTLLSDRGSVLCVEVPKLTTRTPDALCGIAVSQVACGSQHSLALTKDGRVYTWGQGSRGQLGMGTRRLGASPPQHLRALSGIPLVQIAAGGEQSFCLSVSGAVFSWGRNHRGQLGLGDTTDRDVPVAVHYLDMKKTVSVSCGEDHTVALTKDGAVFTFGSGRHGQLGHNSFRNELRPRLVAELWGSKVIQVACGRQHTLMLTDSRRIYSCGCGDLGQLGRGKETPCVPLPVQLPQDSRDDLKIRKIYAGGNSSFAVCMSNEKLHERPKIDCIEGTMTKWMCERDSKTRKQIKQKILRMFCSASCVNGSFLEQRQDKHFQTSSNYSGVDLSLVKSKLEELMERNVVEKLELAVVELLRSLDKKPVGVEGLRIYLLVNELMHVIQEHKLHPCVELAAAAAGAMQRLGGQGLQTLGNWWCSLSAHTMSRYVKVWTQALSALLSSELSDTSGVKNVLKVLQHMYNVNKGTEGRQRIPDSTYCLEIKQEVLNRDVTLWRSKNFPPLLLCNFQFVMDLKSKKMAFEINAVLTQVYFDGDPKLTDVYKRDFFHHLCRDLVSTKSEMFMFNDVKTLVWFPSKATKEFRSNFFLLGLLCGLALYNQCIIDLSFPLVLFKKLLNIKPTLEDMMEFCPTVAESLQWILEYEDDVLKELGQEFTICWDNRDVKLDPQNPEKPVTGQNRKEFVEAYVNHVFNTSVAGVFQEFRRGFFKVCDRDLVKLFRPEELQGVLVGKGVYDWAKLKQNTQYETYNARHPTIQMFWEVFDELSEEQKKDFLWFVTGFRRAPILGMDQTKMCIRMKYIWSGSCDQHFPESLTCHSILELPLYSTKEIMRERLTHALIPESAFFLKAT
ncbi:probable E3 ubiquitin-protein ligase HERC3 isoform X2 [Betta splendens]|uniref:Probable E3 ubiquitin-protein ligase HERC3 isoform X2 n=1 Tax=Betta splendens TaxID=158456 RepID=A0A6P7MVB7_BETSP|nr:probable E3 ubiquitin-protein ligase HERC3 isoform X2 [Betta splendens]